MNTFLRDVTFGARLLLKQRLVSAVVVVTLAFGIGATSPIVSLVSTVLLRPFPHLADPSRLYWFFETRGEIDFDHEKVTPANFARWKEEATQFQSVAAFAGRGQNVTGPAPAWRLAETSIFDAFKEQGQQATPARGQRRLSKILVAGQVALALALSTGAVAAVRDVAHAEHVKLGFEPNGVLVAHMARSDEAAGTPFYRELTTRLGAIPGVKAAGLTSVLPLKRAEQLPVAVAGRPPPTAGDATSLRLSVIDGDYFTAAGTSILAGRPFTPHDDAASPAVTLLSRRAAQRLFATDDAMGKRVVLGENTLATVVGIVDDVESAAATDGGTIHLPLAQRTRGEMIALLQTDSAPLAMENPLRDAVRAIDRDQPVFDVAPLEMVIEEDLWLRRTLARVLALMGGLATLLALVGIYGIAAYSVGQRRAELGIRAALGASPRALVALVAREALWIGGVGTSVGLVLSFLVVIAFSRATRQSALPAEWNVCLAVALFAVVVGASLGPARRAGRVPPSLAMKAS